MIFRSESNVESFALCQIADHPLGEHQLVGCLAGIDGQELDLVLLVYLAVEREIADLGVSVFDLGACAGDITHAQGAEIVEFGERRRFVVAALVGGGEGAGIVGYDVVLKFAHGMEMQSGYVGKRAACLVEHVFGCRFERLAVLVEVGTEHCQRRQWRKRIDEGRAETRHYVEI